MMRIGVGTSFLVLSMLSGYASGAPSYTGSLMDNMRSYVKDLGEKAEITCPLSLSIAAKPTMGG
jgi:hypothetical protein